LVFLRNDIYEILVEETPDRGKEAKALLDWTDPDLLRELLRKRFVYSKIAGKNVSFSDVWRKICVTHVNGEESSQFLIERSLMRPRCLLDLLQHCRSYAVNLRHNRITEEDIYKGLIQYSTDLLVDIGLELRDIFPAANDILYAFIGLRSRLPLREMKTYLKEAIAEEEKLDRITNLLLWHGVLGIVREDGEKTYIYDVSYDMKLLRGLAKKAGGENLIAEINPAFWSALEIKEVD